ncbi:DUF3325 domain-containing protein [Paenalcaligenes suwonensis]|uniref:DUF3325 domain-containing protein n=1 Tax=Paenalcaligenes suwonensis TaxID=1202713 RepID=UPI001407F752|nr:DUF3325 domain-containing protein [Paenalcaligenes suwonensis]NHC61530.1 DUF3325 domain-containing protein [Paenalcaligenes suwonensis]
MEQAWWGSHIALLLMSWLGFLCLGLSMIRHQEDVFERALSTRVTRTLRGMGWLLLSVAAVMAVQQFGWGKGLAAYSGHTSVAAGLVLYFFVLLTRLKQR